MMVTMKEINSRDPTVIGEVVDHPVEEPRVQPLPVEDTAEAGEAIRPQNLVVKGIRTLSLAWMIRIRQTRQREAKR